MATALNKNPDDSPIMAKGLFDNENFNPLEDGIWYLHVRFKNNVGWGPAAHYRLAIDAIPPLPFEIKSSEGPRTDNPSPAITYKAVDQLSGIDFYSIRIGSGNLINTNDADYVLPLQSPGKHLIRVNVRDKAGNATEKTLELEILPIVSPSIFSVSKNIFVGEGELAISGKTLPLSEVILYIKEKKGKPVYSAVVGGDGDGNWAAILDYSLKKGEYFIEATGRDSRGALSLPVKSELFRVREKPLLVISGIGIVALWFYVGLVAVLLIGIAAGWIAAKIEKKQRGRKALIAERDAGNLFQLIEKDLERILASFSDKKIDERELEEIKFLANQAKDAIGKMKKYIIKNIKEIGD